MLIFIVGCLIFFGIHSISIAAPNLRARAVERLGIGPWQGIYSLIALVGLVMLCWGYGLVRAESSWLYVPPEWARPLAFALMLPVFPLLVATYVPGHIKRIVHHPMLLATLLWAIAHLLSNGRLADVILFGGFLLWAALDLWSMRWRDERSIRRLPSGRWNDAIAIVVGLSIYALFVHHLHRVVTGIPLM
ncbi:MAG: NnrU family protein [Lautropia sp.]|nr:NnrU family protein [Lautropia sp.]